jgi:ABC-2 type transport system permease protein
VRALSIAWKDLRRAYRSPAGLVMMLFAPLLLAFVLGLAFGSGDNFSIAPVKTAVVNEDEGAGAGMPAAGATLTAVLVDLDEADLLEVTQVDTPEAARALVDSGDADVAVIVPAGLTETLVASGGGTSGTSGGGLASGESASSAVGSAAAAEIQIYKDPALAVGPSIVTAVVETVVRSLNGTRAAASSSVLLGLSLGMTDTEALAALAAEAAQAYAGLAEGEAPIFLEARTPQIPGAETQESPNVGSQVLVGMMLFFMLFGAATPARTILDEHREGTLPRLFTTPTRRSVILGGKYLSVLLVVLVQAIVLLVAGRLLLGAHWGEVGPVAVLALCSALVAASLGLLTVSFAKTPAQAGAVSSAIFVFLGLISGSFTGTIGLNGVYAIIRRFSPLGWLMEGWTGLLYGGSWNAVALPIVVSLAFAVVLLGIATLFFRRRYA